MARESLILNGLELNDGSVLGIREMTFTPAQKKPQWAGDADADGDVLVRESHHTNSTFDLLIRVLPQATADAGREKAGEVVDKLQSCERTEGGAPLEWKPKDSATTYTGYAELGELLEIPTEMTGDLAGWLLKSPLVRVRLTCRPFLYTEQRVVLEATESSDPLQVAYVGGIEGDVPAEGRLVLTDKATQDRRYAEWGQDVVDSEEGNPSLLLEADEDLVVEGYAGELAEVSVSHSTKVVKASLGVTPVALCSTGPIEHIGSYRLKLRCQASAEGAMLRASYRAGDGPLTPLPWVEPPQVDQWFELDLGEAQLEEVEKGEQISQIQIEGKAEEGATAYIDTLGLPPTRRYGIARAPLDFGVPTTLLVADGFIQSEGNATGKAAEVGGIYEAIPGSDTTDFTISEGKLKRTAVADTGGIRSDGVHDGRGLATPTKLTDFAMRTHFRLEGSGTGWPDAIIPGQILSYVNNTSFVFVRINTVTGGGPWRLVISNGSGSVLGFKDLPYLAVGGTVEGTFLSVVRGNVLTVYVAGPGEELRKEFTVEDPQAGVEGKAAVYDENPGAKAFTRLYDNLAIWKPDQPVVCLPTQSLEIRHDAVEREDSAGTYWSPVPEYRGSHFELDPAGDSERINRVAAKMRRNDNKLEPDSTVTDKHTIEILARELFLAPR